MKLKSIPVSFQRCWHKFDIDGEKFLFDSYIFVQDEIREAWINNKREFNTGRL